MPPRGPSKRGSGPKARRAPAAQRARPSRGSDDEGEIVERALHVAVARRVLGLAAACLLALARPAGAVDLVGQTSAHFQWTAASGPVAAYALYVARNGGAFATSASQVVSTPEAYVSGSYGDTIQVRVAARDASGNEGPASPASDTVRFVAPPALALSTTSLAATVAQGQNAAAQSFTIRNAGGGTLSWSVSSGAGWLSVSPASGSTTGELDSVGVTFSTASLAAGSYSAALTVSGTGVTSQTVSVSLTVTPPPAVLALSTNLLSVTATQGQNAAAQSFTVRNAGGGALSWSVASNTSWLSVSPASGSSSGEPDAITVSISSASLAVGTYQGSISVAASGVPGQSVSVSLSVVPPPKLSLGASSISSSTTQGQAAPAQSLTVRNTGAGTLAYSISPSASWIHVSPSSGTATTETDTLSVSFDTSGLTPGHYSASLSVTAPGALDAPQTVPVTLQISSGLGAPGAPVRAAPAGRTAGR
jgi:hypothetical protein